MSRRGGEPTEEPTAERLLEARRRGLVPISGALSGALAAWALVAGAAMAAPALVTNLMALTRAALTGGRHHAAFPLAGVSGAAGAASLPAMGKAAFQIALAALAPPLVAALVVVVAAGLLQTGGLFAFVSPWPDLDGGARGGRVRRGLTPAVFRQLGERLLAIALLAAVAAGALGGVAPSLPRLVGAAPATVAMALVAWGRRLGGAMLLALLALGIADWLLVRRRYHRSLMMTPDEVKRQRREREGDPRHKAERRRRHREVAGVAGPTEGATASGGERARVVGGAQFVAAVAGEVAAAVRYQGETSGAPRVVARGWGADADAIEAAARVAAVPIVADGALARALAAVAPGTEIPETLYDAVADVLRPLLPVTPRPAVAPASSRAASAGTIQ